MRWPGSAWRSTGSPPVDDDNRVLDALGRALVRPEQPPPRRLSAFLGGIGLERRQSRATPPKLGWLGAGISVVAAMTVLLLLALPTVLSPRESTPSEVASSTRAAVARLRTALVGGDPIAVAEADANLLRIAGKLPVRDAQQARSEAVSAHTEAVLFLRDNPAPIEFVPRPPDGGASVAAPAAPRPSTTLAGRGAATVASPPTTQLVPVPTTLPPAGRRVEIRGVTAELDGSFRVDFTAVGFTPDASGAPGTYAVRFSFDGGQSPTIWTGSSPWAFPLGDGLLYREVCAEVVDQTGTAVPSSGNCRPIG